jgi:predicted GH43/DUF377 family glycosyl hydrolase
MSYHVGAALLDRSNPTIVLARSSTPVLSPLLIWERTGRRADTVFPCGLEILRGMEYLRLYYGAADTSIGAADVRLDALLETLTWQATGNQEINARADWGR